MAQSDDNLDAFLREEPWTRYDGARVGFIAFRDGASLLNMMASIVFLCGNEGADGATVNVDPFVLHVEYCNKKESELLMRGLVGDSPRLRLRDHEVSLMPAPQQRGWTQAHEDPYAWQILGWRSRRLQWSGAASDDYCEFGEFDEVGRRLPSASPRSFSDWAAAAKWAIPAQRRFSGASEIGPGCRGHLTVHAPTYARLLSAACTPTSGALQVHVDVLERRDELCVVARADDTGIEVVRLERAAFKIVPQCGHLVASTPIPPDVGPMTTELSVGGQLIQKMPAGVPPSAVRLYTGIDPGARWLNRLYERRAKNRAEKYEQWVTNLLAMAGIATVHFGHGQEDFPDIVGWLGSNLALAVEATLAAPDLNKLTKFQTRVLAMRAALSTSVPMGKVVAAVVFDQSESEVPQLVSQQAATDGIALVPRERALGLRDGILSGTLGGPEVIAFLTSSRP